MVLTIEAAYLIYLDTEEKLARRLPERTQMIQALAGILTFSDKIIDNAYKERIKEEMQMIQIGQMLMIKALKKEK